VKPAAGHRRHRGPHFDWRSGGDPKLEHRPATLPSRQPAMGRSRTREPPVEAPEPHRTSELSGRRPRSTVCKASQRRARVDDRMEESSYGRFGWDHGPAAEPARAAGTPGAATRRRAAYTGPRGTRVGSATSVGHPLRYSLRSALSLLMRLDRSPARRASPGRRTARGRTRRPDRPMQSRGLLGSVAAPELGPALPGSRR